MDKARHQVGSATSLTAIGATWMVAWRMVTRGFGLISTLILARLLVPADFGLVALATTFSASIDSLSELGLQAALVRQRDDDPALLDTAFTLQLARGLLTGVIVTACAWGAGSWLGDTRLTPMLLVLAVLAVVAGLDNIAVIRFQRDLRFDMEFRLLFVPRLLQFVTSTVAAITLHSYWALIIGTAVGRVSRAVMTYWVQPYRPTLTLSRWRDLAGFSFWSWASSLAYIVWNRCDAFLLAPSFGIGPLGVFLLSMELGLLPTSEIVDPASRALYPGVAMAQNRGTNPIQLALPLTSTLMTLVVPFSLGISATAGYVIAVLLGPTWVIGRPVIAIAALISIITPLTFVFATVLNATGRVKKNFWVVAGSALVRVFAVYWVAGYARLDWAALAICGTICVEASIFVVQVSSQGQMSWHENAPGFLRIASSSGIVATLLWLTRLGWTDVHMPPFPALLIGGAIGLGCVAGCAGLQLTFWVGAGRPRGPEATVIGLVSDFATKLRRWTGRAWKDK